MYTTGYINCTMHYNVLGQAERIDYEWEGGPVTDISRSFISDLNKDGTLEKIGVLCVGPFRLKMVKDDPWLDRARFVRMDYPFWRLVFAWHRYGKIFEIAYHRLIVTLAIWHLAEYNRAVIPTWHDIYAIKKPRKWIGRLRGTK